MSELRELYHEIIIDHGREPRNYGALLNANLHKEGYNPLCGDKIVLHVREQAGKIENLQFEGCGCAISMASASLMTEALKGKSIAEVTEIFELFRQLVTEGISSELQKERLGKLTVLGGVCEFPARIKCATLAWHTLNAVLQNDDSNVCTE